MFSEKVRNFIVKLQGLSDEKKKIILLGVVIVLGLGLGSLWVVSTINTLGNVGSSAKFVDLPAMDLSDAGVLDNLKKIGDQPEEEATDAPLDPDGWKTYVGGEYGFQVKYPPAYFLKEQANKENYLFYINFYKTEAPEPGGLPTPYVSVSVYDQPDSLEAWLRENGIEKWGRNDDFFVDGQQAIHLTNPGKLGVAALVIVSHNGKLFSLANFDSGSFKKFISSFKFTN